MIRFGERLLFVDLGATAISNSGEGQLIGAELAGCRIVIEVKEFRSRSVISDLEQAIGQYSLYQLLLNKVDPEREIFLAISSKTYNEIFNEPIGKVVIRDLPLKLVVINLELSEVEQWIPSNPIEKSSNESS